MCVLGGLCGGRVFLLLCFGQLVLETRPSFPSSEELRAALGLEASRAGSLCCSKPGLCDFSCLVRAQLERDADWEEEIEGR